MNPQEANGIAAELCSIFEEIIRKGQNTATSLQSTVKPHTLINHLII